MSLYDVLKDSVSLVNDFKDTPHYEKIVSLRDQLIALSEEKIQLYEENQELKRRLQVQDEFSFKKPFYYKKDDDNPFCPTCMDVNSRPVRLYYGFVEGRGVMHSCQHCKSYFPGS